MYRKAQYLLSCELVKFGKNSKLSSTQTFVLCVGVFVVVFVVLWGFRVLLEP